MVVRLEAHGLELLETSIIEPEALTTFTVPTPQRRFSDTNPKSLSPRQGLTELGPYDVNTSDRHLRRSFDRCEVVCAYPDGDHEIRDELAALVEYLRDGYTPKGGNDANLPPFHKSFRLANAVFPSRDEFVAYGARELGPFEDAVAQLVENVRKRLNRPIVLVAVRSHKSIAATQDIYKPLKRLLTRKEIPSQFLSDYPAENTSLGVLYRIGTGQAVGYASWNIALAMYTKLGGVPWAVTQSGKPEELIDITIGLRFAPLPTETPGFCLGIATVLDRFGRLIGTVPLEDIEYLRATDTPISGMTLSSESARRLVTEALDKVLLDPRTQTIMQARKPLSVVLHKLGPFHAEEMFGIREAMSAKLRGREATVGFASVIAGETLALFGPPSEGRAIPAATGLKIARDTALLYTQSSDRRFKTPVTVKVRNLGDAEGALQSVEHACAHIQTLCGLHWQTVVSGALRLPADLDFAGHIARAFAADLQPNPGSLLWKTQWYL